jgi:uncharacterized protein (TIGR02117 family)
MLCFCCLLAVATTGCPAPSAPRIVAHPGDEVVYVIAGGWHTELALPISAIGGALAALKPGFTNARYLVFGWGARDYYMSRDPGLGDLLRATVPGPAVLLVVPLQTSPETFAGAGNTVALPLSRSGAVQLSRFLWDYLAKEAKGALRPVAAGPYPGSVFYASTGTFDISHTCNTWTAEALRAAGLPVTSAGVVYARQLLDQLPPPGTAVPAERGAAQR